MVISAAGTIHTIVMQVVTDNWHWNTMRCDITTQGSVGLAVPSMLIYEPRSLSTQPSSRLRLRRLQLLSEVLRSYALKYTSTEACLPSVVSSAEPCRVASNLWLALDSLMRASLPVMLLRTSRNVYTVSVSFCGAKTLCNTMAHAQWAHAQIGAT